MIFSMWLLVIATALAPSSSQRPLGPGALKSLDETDFSEIDSVKRSLEKLKHAISGGAAAPRAPRDFTSPVEAFSSLLEQARRSLPDPGPEPSDDPKELDRQLAEAERGLRAEGDAAENGAEALNALEQHAKEAGQVMSASQALLDPNSILNKAKVKPESLLESPVAGGQLRSLQSTDFSELESVQNSLRKLKARIEDKAQPAELKKWSRVRPLDPTVLPPPAFSLLQQDPQDFARAMEEAKAALRKAMPARLAQQIADDMIAKVDDVKGQGHLDKSSFFEITGNLEKLQASEKSIDKLVKQVQEHQRLIKATPLGKPLPYTPDSFLQTIATARKQGLGDPEQSLDDDAAAFDDAPAPPAHEDAPPQLGETQTPLEVAEASDPARSLDDVQHDVQQSEAFDGEPKTVDAQVPVQEVMPSAAASGLVALDGTQALALAAENQVALQDRARERARAVSDDENLVNPDENLQPNYMKPQWVGLGASMDPLERMSAGADGTIKPAALELTTADPSTGPSLAALVEKERGVSETAADLEQADATGDALLGSDLAEDSPGAVWDLKNRFETPGGDVRPLSSWLEEGAQSSFRGA